MQVISLLVHQSSLDSSLKSLHNVESGANSCHILQMTQVKSSFSQVIASSLPNIAIVFLKEVFTLVVSSKCSI